MLSPMKKLLAIIVLSLCVITSSQADDIRDFQIEGISIGDSLLDEFSIEQIKSIKQDLQYPKDKFIVYQLGVLKSLDNYDLLNVSVKKDSKKYIVSHIQGGIRYSNAKEFTKCNSQKKKIVEELDVLFKNLKRRDEKYKSSYDNKSLIDGTEFYFDSGDVIAINCNDWIKEAGLSKILDVAVATEEFLFFITKEAYK
jgi:hypothetical protein